MPIKVISIGEMRGMALALGADARKVDVLYTYLMNSGTHGLTGEAWAKRQIELDRAYHELEALSKGLPLPVYPALLGKPTNLEPAPKPDLNIMSEEETEAVLMQFGMTREIAVPPQSIPLESLEAGDKIALETDEQSIEDALSEIEEALE
jgi:hypothetical protein